MAKNERRSYTLMREPEGPLYEGLLLWGARSGKKLLLVVREGLELSSAGRRVLDRLEPFIESKERSSQWPGTVLFDGKAEVSKFRIAEPAVPILTEASPRLFGWQQPELPEDLGLLYTDGSPWLVSVAHEEDAYLCLTEEERAQVGRELPDLAAILDPNPGDL